MRSIVNLSVFRVMFDNLLYVVIDNISGIKMKVHIDL